MHHSVNYRQNKVTTQSLRDMGKKEIWNPGKTNSPGLTVFIKQTISVIANWDRDEMTEIQISLKFVPEGPMDNNPALIQIMAWCCTVTHICVTRPQWFNYIVLKMCFQNIVWKMAAIC